MKKTYIIPEMVVVKIQTPQLLADSITEQVKNDEEISDDFEQQSIEIDF